MFDIYKIIQTQIVSDRLLRKDIVLFRKVCRWYSEKFHTPLQEVEEGKTISWSHILTHYYESQIENLKYDSVFNIAVQDYLPEIADELDKVNEEYAKALEEEQRLSLIKAKKNDKKEVTPTLSEEPRKIPSINFNFEDK